MSAIQRWYYKLKQELTPAFSQFRNPQILETYTVFVFHIWCHLKTNGRATPRPNSRWQPVSTVDAVVLPPELTVQREQCIPSTLLKSFSAARFQGQSRERTWPLGTMRTATAMWGLQCPGAQSWPMICIQHTCEFILHPPLVLAN